MPAIWLRLCFSVLVLLPLQACGLGAVVAIAASDDGVGGSVNGEPSLRSFTAGVTKLSPLELRFTLVDPESDPLAVTLELEHPPGSPRRRLTLVGPTTELDGLAASPAGTTHARSWDAAVDLGTSARVEDVRLILTLAGGRGTVRPGAIFLELVLAPGNDAPAIELDADQLPHPPGEVGGPVPLNFTVRDSASEPVELRIQYNDVAAFPESGWKSARPAGLDPAEPTPEEAFRGITALAAGTRLTFAWDSGFDLAGRDVSVRLRLSARESAAPNATSAFAELGPVKVDNNLPPEVVLDVAALIFDPDRRRVVPLTLRVHDDEEDDVRVAIQWRHEDEAFPALPATAGELRSALDDPVRRRALHIAREAPRVHGGRLIPVDGGAERARLPELATTEMLLVTSRAEGPREALRGKELEVLGSTVPARVSDLWPGPPAEPVAVLPRGDGRLLLLLETLPGGGWRLSELERMSGRAGPLAPIGGESRATAMAFDGSDGSVLVALTENGDWGLGRADLRAGSFTLLHENLGRLERGAIRDLARLDADEALVTVGDAVLRVSYPSDAPSRASAVGTTGWTAPHGIAVDPGDPRRAFVAEPLLDRITLLDVASSTRSPLVVDGLVRPRELEVDRATNELVMLSDTRLERIAIARALDADGDGVGERRLSVVARDLPADARGLSAGPDGFTGFVAGTGSVFAGGGVEQSRALADYDPATQTARVEPPFEPPVTARNGWRILDRFSLAGRDRDVFRWDTSETGTGGTLFLRVLGIDEDVGRASDEVPKELLSELDGAFEDLPIAGDALELPPDQLHAVDLDADGDLDLLSADARGAELLRQTLPGSFESVPGVLPAREIHVVVDVDQDGWPDLLSRSELFRQAPPDVFGSPVTFGTGRAVAAGDLTGDGLVDVVSSDPGNRTAIWRQTAGLAFAPGASFPGIALLSTHLADLDGNGRLDIVGVEQDTLVVLLQDPAGTFARRDLVVRQQTACAPSASDLRIADLDADGELDVVASTVPALCFDELVGSDYRFYFDVASRAPGDDLPDRVFGDSQTTPDNWTFALVDVDADGSADIVGGRSFVARGPSGDYDLARPILAGQDPGIVLAAVDLNGDGRHDLLSSGFAPGSVRLFLRDPFGASATPCDGPVGFSVATYQRAAALDWNGDNLLDVVATSFTDEVDVFLQELPGRFDPVAQDFHFFEFFATSLLDGDLDGDGDADLLLANPSPGVSCRTRALGAVVPCLDLAGARNLALADMDGDGGLELIVEFPRSEFPEVPGRLALFELRAEPPRVIAGEGSFVPGDLDLDGDLDLLQVAATREVQLHEQLSPGSFASATLLPGLADQALDVVDVDRDGVPDVVLGREGATDVWFGSEEGGLERVEVQGTGSVRDVNGDGAPDLVLTTGALQLQIQPRFFVWQTAQAPFQGPDLDGDGDDDRIQLPGASLFFCYGGR